MITLTDVDRVPKFFYRDIPKEILCIMSWEFIP